MSQLEMSSSQKILVNNKSDEEKSNSEEKMNSEVVEKIKNNFIKQYVEKASPLENANFFQRIFMTWMNPVVKVSNQIEFKEDMIYKLPKSMKLEQDMQQLDTNFDQMRTKYASKIEETKYEDFSKKPNVLLRTFCKTYKFDILLCLFLTFVEMASGFLGTGLYYKTIQSTKEKDINDKIFFNSYKVAFFIMLIAINRFLSDLLENNIWLLKDNLIGSRLRCILQALVFSKASKKGVLREQEYGVGEIQNLTDSDVEKFCSISTKIIEIIQIPFELIFSFIILIFMTGKAILPTSVVLLFFLAIIKVVNRFNEKFQKDSQEVGDEKMKKTIGAYNNIRFIKMEALENFFLTSITKLKSKQLAIWIKSEYFGCILEFVHMLNYCIPFATLYYFYSYYGYELSVETIFTIGHIFDKFRDKIHHIGDLLSGMTEFFVSAKRLNNFMISDELDFSQINWNKDNKNVEEKNDTALKFDNGNYYWVDQKQTDYLEKRKKEKELEDENAKKSWFSQFICKKKQNKSNEKMAIKPEVLETESNDTDSDLFSNDQKPQNVSPTKKSTLNDSISTLNTLPKHNEQKPVLHLKNINLKIQKGACVAIIGKIGSGKTSLINSLFGELFCDNSNVQNPNITINGSVSYVSQKSWVQSKTLKENILFYSDFDNKRYKDSIYYSALTDDLKLLEDKDRTMLGDKGVNLSGGQKTRLSVARGIYANKDIIIMDDPISALDVKVGKFIMEEGIQGYLKNKTRIISTHAIAFLKYFDYIYIMDDGKVIKEGTYHDIKVTDEYKEIQRISQENEKKSTEEKTEKQEELAKKESAQSSSKDPTPKRCELLKRGSTQSFELLKRGSTQSFELLKRGSTQKAIKKDSDEIISNIITKEDDDTSDKVTLSIIWKYIKMNGGVLFIVGTLLMTYWNKFFDGCGDYYLQYWTTLSPDNRSLKWFQILSTSQHMITCFGRISRRVCRIFQRKKFMKQLNFLMNLKLIYASVNKFWDRVPMGRVINRLTTNADKSEEDLDNYFQWSFWVFADLTSAFIMISITTSPLTWIFIILQAWASFQFLKYTRKAKSGISKIESQINSPINQLYTEALRGLTEIRVFGKKKDVLKEFYEKVDVKRSLELLEHGTNIYTNVRLQMLSQISTIPGFLMLIYIQPSSGLVALTINNLLWISGIFNDMFHFISWTETNFINFNKCSDIMDLEPENGYNDIAKTIDNFNKNLPIFDNEKESSQKGSWLNKGELTFKNVNVKYRPELGNVLKDISFNIKGGEKVGIVGRTGAGKTTLISAIYRSFENYDGSIKIDDQEINKLDLKTLRKGMTIIPQDPHLFNDTLKNNLDPLDEFVNEDIENIQQSFEIWDKFSDNGGLEFKIDDDGKNLSQGEKQLLCMARALLSQKKLILMDEATANVDIVTEAKIQKAIETFFSDSTVLIIAHRLSTIMFCDKVMVLDQGRKAEFDRLENLKSNEQSAFGKMIAMNSDIQNFMK